MKEYLAMWKNYANFSGRTDRRGYWMAVLFNFFAGLILSAILLVIPKLAFISSLYGLALLIPGLAICIRRLRDAGKNWPWIFICLVPFVGWIILIILLAKPSV